MLFCNSEPHSWAEQKSLTVVSQLVLIDLFQNIFVCQGIHSNCHTKMFYKISSASTNCNHPNRNVRQQVKFSWNLHWLYSPHPTMNVMCTSN